MSGSPKYSQARLEEQARRRLEQERRRQAVEAERRRRAIEEEERRRLEAEERARRALLSAQVAAGRGHLADLRARLAGLRGDEVVMAWAGAEVAELDLAVAEADTLLGREDWQAAETRIRAGQEAIEHLLARSQERQLQEEIRAHLVSGLQAVLERQGFLVAAPDLARPGDLDSAVVIRAVRPDRRSLQVEVPVGGRVAYEVDGWARRQESGPDGAPAATCDEAEARLEAIHAQLAEDFGIRMDELQWQGKHPLRRQKGAKDLPGGGPTARTRGGKA